MSGSTAYVFDLAVATVREASEVGIPLRLFGGQAVRLLTPDLPARFRGGQDIDLATVSRSGVAVAEFLEMRGFTPDETFNALNGHKQMYFLAPDGATPVDLVLNRLAMCHELDFRDRFDVLPYTLDLADLLLSKLQIVEQTAKDCQDMLYLLSAHPVVHDAGAGISAKRIGEVVGADWGWWRTVTINLERLIISLDSGEATVPSGSLYSPVAAAHALLEIAESTPKSRRWKLRSKVGERVRWYELPETVQH